MKAYHGRGRRAVPGGAIERRSVAREDMLIKSMAAVQIT